MIVSLHPEGFTHTPREKKHKFYQAVTYMYFNQCLNRRVRSIMEIESFGSLEL